MTHVSLQATQALFTKTMLDLPSAVSDPAPEIFALFSSSPESLPERLKIYRNTIVGSLTDVLIATYPLITALTGEDFARGLMRSFILAHPPQSGCLIYYGAGLDGFLRAFPPTQGLPYLPDIAHLEWAFNESYYAPDAPALRPEDIRDVPLNALGDMLFPLQDSVRLIRSRWPLRAIRDFCLADPQQRKNTTLDLDQGGDSVMIFRRNFSTHVIGLTSADYAALFRLQSGDPLSSALISAFEQDHRFDIAIFLKTYFDLETFSACVPNIVTGYPETSK